jgi:hypothetical protein
MTERKRIQLRLSKPMGREGAKSLFHQAGEANDLQPALNAPEDHQCALGEYKVKPKRISY